MNEIVVMHTAGFYTRLTITKSETRLKLNPEHQASSEMEHQLKTFTEQIMKVVCPVEVSLRGHFVIEGDAITIKLFNDSKTKRREFHCSKL